MILAQQYRLELASVLQYRASTAIWMIGAILEPMIFLVIWSTVAIAQGGSVDGLTPASFAAYYIAAFFVGEMTYSWNVWDYERYVRDGKLSAHLLRPVHPFTINIAANLANKSYRMLIVFAATLLLCLIFRPAFDFSLWSMLSFIPALLLATALFFVCDLLVAMVAFWTTSTSAAARAWDTVFILFSGYFAPLQIFPPAFQAVAWVLPFRWTLAFPVELVLGALTPREALGGMAMQLFWLGVLSGLVMLAWRRGIRRYGAVGG